DIEPGRARRWWRAPPVPKAHPSRREQGCRQRPWNRGPPQRGWCPAGSRPARRTRTGQRLGELRRRLPAVSGELLERARDGGVDVVRDRLALDDERAGLLRQDPGKDRLGGGPRERRLAGQHFIKDDAERVDVGPRVQVRLTGRLLGTHVFGRAKTRARLRPPGP